MNPQRSIALYRRLTSLYPKSFRDKYEDDLVAAFTAQLDDKRTAHMWLFTIHDLMTSIPSQYLEARMKRPTHQSVTIIATVAMFAALVLGVVAGTGPVVGLFVLIALLALVVATLARTASRPASGLDPSGKSHWRTFLAVGVAVLTAVLVVINVPPYNDRELPGLGWVLMMTSLVTSVGLITVGITIGIAGRSTRHETTG
jgi:hypothetical protein